MCLQGGVGLSPDSEVLGGGRTALDNKTSLLNTPPPRSFCGPRFRDYNPFNYCDSIGAMEDDGGSPNLILLIICCNSKVKNLTLVLYFKNKTR